MNLAASTRIICINTALKIIQEDLGKLTIFIHIILC